MTPFYLTTMKGLPDEGKGNLDVSQKSVTTSHEESGRTKGIRKDL